MLLNRAWGFFAHPHEEWEQIMTEKEQEIFGRQVILHIVIGALIPAVSALLGTTVIGWRVGFGEPVWLTFSSAIPMVLLTYFAMIAGVLIMGFFIHWMSRTYNSQVTVIQSTAFIAYAATPMFIAGIAGIYPSLWIGMLFVTAGVSYSIYLMYLGTPRFMKVPEEQGFLYASSILGVGLVILVAILATTVVFWNMGLGPVYTD